MKRFLACWVLLGACLFAAPSLPVLADGPARPDTESFEIAQLDGLRVGVRRTTVWKHDPEGKQLRTSAMLELTLRRYGAPVRLRREEGSVETPQGKVLAVYMRQGQSGGGKQMSLVGLVRKDVLEVKIDGGRLERKVTWPADAVGLAGQERMFADRKCKPGDRFTFRRYEPTYNAVLSVRVAVMDRAVVDVLGARTSLLRVEMTPEPLTAPGQSVQPPRAVWWLDENNLPVRRQVEVDGLGTLILTRTTREKALAPAGPTADVGTRSLVPLNRTIVRPYDTRLVVYKVTVLGEGDPRGLFASDSHQEVRAAEGKTFELVVHPVRPADPAAGGPRAAPEYLATSRYIDHDHPRVRELARKAVAGETDPWKKALRVERWVKGLMRTDNSAPLGPASEAARTLRGDCRHHALLTAALCRAAGVPARTAVGLLYVYRGGPKLGFHLWAEVYAGGAWRGVDSTLGKGGVSAAHVKIADHSWDKVESLTPFLPVSRVIGKVRVEVVRVEK